MIRLLARLGAAALMAASVAAGCTGGSGDEAASHPNAIDPTPYRAEIESLERVLYKHSPPDYGDGDLAASMLMRLYTKVSERVANPMVRGRVDEILFLASYADIGESGYSLPDLKPMRERWERIRAEVFTPADWFASGGGDIDAAQLRPVPTVTEQQVYELSRVIERIEVLVEGGRDRCDELGEPEYSVEAPGLAGRAQINRWHQWGRVWSDDIDAVAAFLPPAPAWDGEPDFVMAYQEIERAIHELRLVPHGAGIWPTPFRHLWDQRFASAERSVQMARDCLASAAIR